MASPFKRAAGLALTLAASLLVLVSCGSGGGNTRQTPEDLWDRKFISTTVTADGEPRPLVPDTRIAVTFEDREDQGVVRWQAGCNTFAADVEVTADRLHVGVITGTEMGCPGDLQDQDDWLTGFFDSDPRWRLIDDRLTLTSDDTVIELEASRG